MSQTDQMSQGINILGITSVMQISENLFTGENFEGSDNKREKFTSQRS